MLQQSGCPEARYGAKSGATFTAPNWHFETASEQLKERRALQGENAQFRKNLLLTNTQAESALGEAG